MDTSLILLLLVVVIVSVVFGNFISSIIQKKNSFGPKDIIDKIEGIKNHFNEEFKPLSEGFVTGKTLIEEKAQNIQTVHEKLVNSLTGSSRFGATGELLLENFFKNSGLVENTQYIQNQNYKKDGTTLTVEFAIKHPTGLVLPIDAHWTKTLYEHLLELRKEPPIDTDMPILVAGDPEKISEKKRLKIGIPIEGVVVDEINQIIDQQGLKEKL